MVIFHSYVTLPEGTRILWAKNEQIITNPWRPWDPPSSRTWTVVSKPPPYEAGPGSWNQGSGCADFGGLRRWTSFSSWNSWGPIFFARAIMTWKRLWDVVSIADPLQQPPDSPNGKVLRSVFSKWNVTFLVHVGTPLLQLAHDSRNPTGHWVMIVPFAGLLSSSSPGRFGSGVSNKNSLKPRRPPGRSPTFPSVPAPKVQDWYKLTRFAIEPGNHPILEVDFLWAIPMWGMQSQVQSIYIKTPSFGNWQAGRQLRMNIINSNSSSSSSSIPVGPG